MRYELDEKKETKIPSSVDKILLKASDFMVFA